MITSGIVGATSALALISTPMPLPASMASSTSLHNVILASPVVRPRPATESVPPTNISWADQQLRRLSALGPNWDGYGAHPIPRARIDQLAGILGEQFKLGLPEGRIVPGADGSLQVEWHFSSASFGFLVDADATLYAWHRSRPDGEFVDAEDAGALALINAAVLQALV